MKRVLRLRSETLSDLSAAELGSVAAGTHLTYHCTRYCGSNEVCLAVPTLPLDRCVNY